MKIWHVIRTHKGISETFITDLVELFANNYENYLVIADKCHYDNHIATRVKEVKYYSRPLYISKAINFITNFQNQEKKIKSRFRYSLFNSSRKIEQLLRYDRPDIIFIDYAENAILWYESLVKYDIPFLFHVHGYDITSRMIDPCYRAKLKQVFNSSKAIITASQYMKRLVTLAGCPQYKIHVIPYGIKGSSGSMEINKLDKTKNPSVIFLGRLTPKKHPIALLHAFKLVTEKIKNATLSIIGDGPMKSEVISCISELGLDESVNMIGALPQEKALKIVSSHWIFAQHSVTAYDGDQEGFAISPAEAALLGLPVVSTQHNGIPEHVLDGETGYLVREFDYEAMADKIIYLFENPEIALQMGTNGSERIKKYFNSDLRNTRILKLLETIVEENL